RPARVSFPWDLPYIRPRKIEEASRWSTRKLRTLRPDELAPRSIATLSLTPAPSKAKLPRAARTKTDRRQTRPMRQARRRLKRRRLNLNPRPPPPSRHELALVLSRPA